MDFLFEDIKRRMGILRNVLTIPLFRNTTLLVIFGILVLLSQGVGFSIVSFVLGGQNHFSPYVHYVLIVAILLYLLVILLYLYDGLIGYLFFKLEIFGLYAGFKLGVSKYIAEQLPGKALQSSYVKSKLEQLIDGIIDFVVSRIAANKKTKSLVPRLVAKLFVNWMKDFKALIIYVMSYLLPKRDYKNYLHKYLAIVFKVVKLLAIVALFYVMLRIISEPLGSISGLENAGFLVDLSKAVSLIVAVGIFVFIAIQLLDHTLFIVKLIIYAVVILLVFSLLTKLEVMFPLFTVNIGVMIIKVLVFYSVIYFLTDSGGSFSVLKLLGAACLIAFQTGFFMTMFYLLFLFTIDAVELQSKLIYLILFELIKRLMLHEYVLYVQFIGIYMLVITDYCKDIQSSKIIIPMFRGKYRSCLHSLNLAFDSRAADLGRQTRSN